jgi:hypothetical protein
MNEIDREYLAILFGLNWTVGACGMLLLAAALTHIWGRTREPVWAELALVGLVWGVGAASVAAAPWLGARDPMTLTVLSLPVGVATMRAAWIVWSGRHDD